MNREMKSKGRFLAAAGLALVLGGCDTGERRETATAPGAEVPGAARPVTPYEKDVLLLKASESDPARLAASLAELRARHGIAPSPLLPLPLADVPAEAVTGLSKAAAIKYFTPRTLNFGVTPTPDVAITVPANATVEAWTTRNAANSATDPMLVGFYRTSGDQNSQAYKTAFIGFNDDATGLDPRIAWKNTTGASKQVRFVAFAYNTATTGAATIQYKVVGGASYAKFLPLTATRIPLSAPNTQGCTGPTLTRIGLQRLSGQSNTETVTLAYNAVTKRGGYIYSSSTQIILDDVLPTTGSSFLIGYTQANSDGFYDGLTYKSSQLDLYSCP